jgi:hypothetical protein
MIENGRVYTFLGIGGDRRQGKVCVVCASFLDDDENNKEPQQHDYSSPPLTNLYLLYYHPSWYSSNPRYTK